MFRQFAFLFLAITLHAQSIRYEVPKTSWDKNLGSHRVVVRVDAPAAAVRANLEWRRRDPQPEKHGIVVMDAAGKRVENALATLVTNDAGEVVFQAAAAGEYAVYFLPGNPGGGSFPAAKYLGPQDTGSVDWKGKLGDVKKLPEAKAIRWEARSEHDRFNEMEIIATKAEKDAWLAAHPGDVHVFLESRERPVRMFDQVPEIWLKREKPPEFVARPGEVFMFQVCVWAAKRNETIASLNGEIPGLGRIQTPHQLPPEAHSMSPEVFVRHGTVGTVWCFVKVPLSASVGAHTGSVAILNGSAPVAISIRVAGEPLADGGDSEPWKHTKLRWLDSPIAGDSSPTKPFIPLRREGRTIHCLGRSVTLGDDGLPRSITSFFNSSVTGLSTEQREILAAPMRFVTTLTDGTEDTLKSEEMVFDTMTAKGGIRWSVRSINKSIAAHVFGLLEPDGHLSFRCEISSRENPTERGFRLEIPRTADLETCATVCSHPAIAARPFTVARCAVPRRATTPLNRK